MNRYDNTKDMTEARSRPNGGGMAATWTCDVCKQRRIGLMGSRGRSPRKRCAVCVDEGRK